MRSRLFNFVFAFVRSSGVWFGVIIVWRAPMSSGLSSTATSEEDGILTLWSFLGELIEGQASATGSGDSGSSSGSESQSTDVHFWYVDKSLVVQHVTDNNQGFTLVGFSGQFDKSGD